MDHTDRFVSDENISRFAGQLRNEADPAKQDVLRRLLIEEEDRFGASEARLRVVDRNIADGAAQIARQTQLVAKLKDAGADTGAAERTLKLFQAVQAQFIAFRARIYDGLERSGP